MRHALLLTLVSAIGTAAQAPGRLTARPQSTEVRVVRTDPPAACSAWGALALEACASMPGCSAQRIRADDTTPLSRALQSSLDARLARACSGRPCGQVRTRNDRNSFECRGRDELCMTRSIEFACIGPQRPATIPARPREKQDREIPPGRQGAAHQPTVLQAEGSRVRVLDLGTIGPRRSDTDPDLQAPAGRTTPLSRDDLLPAARLAGASDIGQTFRISVHKLQDGPIGMSWRCYKGDGYPTGGFVNTQLSGHIACEGSVSMNFAFHPIAPNSMYLVTLEHAFSSFQLRVRTGDGSEQSSTVENPDRPFFVVFKTMPGQQFAMIELYAATPGNTNIPAQGVFYGLHLSRLQ